jgi:nucleoside recognition membrane protein YjiH
MLLLRFALVLLLIVSGVCFAVYAVTRNPRYLRWGWTVLKVALAAALGFFGILVLERLL